jgi:hypothetical protein
MGMAVPEWVQSQYGSSGGLGVSLSLGNGASFLGGLAQGFASDGAAGTASGLASGIGIAVNAIGDYFSYAGTYWIYGEDAAFETEMGQSIDGAATAVIKYGPKVAQLMSEVQSGNFSPETLAAIESAKELTAAVLSAMADQWQGMSEEERAWLAGRITGMILFEGALAVGTAGAASAVSAAAKAGKFAHIATKLESLFSPGTASKILNALETALKKPFNNFDDDGNCASFLTRLVHGQCFVAGTPVTVSSLPDGFTGDETLGLAGEWLARHSWSQAQGPGATLAELETGISVKQLIERVPLGARVPSLNPLRWEYDPTFAEPDESSWAKLTLVMRKRDGGVVDAELLRPRAWIEAAGIAVGKPLPLNLPELDIRDQVEVTAIEACPAIAEGAGSVVTARFVTREVHLVASVQLRGPRGELETLTGTQLHPIWSVDRADWIPLSQLQPGERLLCSDATTSWGGESERGQAHAIVLGVTLSTVCEPVYNLEIHGEHVYQVGELGVLVHNAGKECERVYTHLDEAGEINYIGLTDDLKRRAGEHRLDELKTGQSMRPSTEEVDHDVGRTIEAMMIRRKLAEARARGLIDGTEPIAEQLQMAGLLNKNRGRDPSRWVNIDPDDFIKYFDEVFDIRTPKKG